MKKLWMLGVLLPVMAVAQNKKKEDIAAIKSMCGCYEISFNFAETFSPQKDYQYHDRYLAGGLEYSFVVEETKDKIVLQHLLVVEDTIIVKHWRQDWLYENTDQYAYDVNDKWKYVALDSKSVKGQWTQRVFQVDDSPRYEASASWVHYDGKHYWESVADAPLPRREHTHRSDYNVMTRKNRHEITSYGWLHEQDNQKVLRADDKDELLAWEKGYNTYTKTDNSKCAVAQKWWDANEKYWADVRVVWDELFESKQDLAIKMRADGKALSKRLYDLADQMDFSKYDSAKAQSEIRSAIKVHLENSSLLATNP